MTVMATETICSLRVRNKRSMTPSVCGSPTKAWLGAMPQERILFLESVRHEVSAVTKGTHKGSNPRGVLKLTTEAATRRNRRGETAHTIHKNAFWAVNRPHRFRAELIASPPAGAVIRVTRAASSAWPPSAGARRA